MSSFFCCNDDLELCTYEGKTVLYATDSSGKGSVILEREDIDELVAALLQVRNKTDGEAEKLLKGNS